ncbi:MAG: bifunctional demethylmenaquinone methyltransferase/2-methoxy-6-polyprenyl-1,4-benzoquinol methylase UbiE [Nitrospinota bacterium]
MLATEKSELPMRGASQIQAMFDAVAPRYDLLNRLLSAGFDRYWRKVAVSEFGPVGNKSFLDVATGTADIALEIGKRDPKPSQIIGMDFSLSMLRLGNKKISNQKLFNGIKLIPGSAENIPLKDHTFDGTITAFGVRNFADAKQGLREMHRILKPNGKIVVLEFSFPANGVLQWLYRFYFEKILPLTGRIISGHKNAYSYLPASVANFPQGEAFKNMLEDSGFNEVTSRPLTLGIVSLYTGRKNA